MAAAFSPRVNKRRDQARGLWLTIVFLILSLVIGGAGADYPLNQLIIELLAVALISRSVLAAPVARGGAFWAVLAIIVSALVLLALQLVPLPPAVWHALPDRKTATRIYETIGWARRWHAASLTPDTTLEDMLAVLPPLAAFLSVAALSERRRLLLLRIVVAIALIGTTLAALQVAAGAQDAPLLFETSHRGFGVGFFVNRNHQAAFLLVAIVLTAVPGVVSLGGGGARPGQRNLVIVPLAAFLALGVLATTSRTGLVLLPLALLAVLFIVLQPGRKLPYVAGCAAFFGLAAVALLRSALLQRTLARFATAADDLRYQFWDNTRFAIGSTLPWGTGFGSFDTVYRSVEPLAQLSSLRVNHAHNDYLEVALEGGAPAIVLIVAGIAVAVGAFAVGWRHATSEAERARILAGAAGLAMILLFSLVDYPLRMAAIGVLLGVLVGLAVPAPRRSTDAIGRGRALHVAVSFIGLLVGGFAVADGVAAAVTQHGNPAAGARIAPWLAESWSQLANAEQLKRRTARSAAAAKRALAIAPLDATAVRALGYAQIAHNESVRGQTLLQLGGALGWHDTVNQFWLAQAALQAGDFRVGVERIDALMRRHVAADMLQRELRAIFLYPAGRGAIVERLAGEAPWRQGFLNAIADDAPGHVPQIRQLLAELRARSVPVGVNETALIRWRLSDAGNFEAARQIWLASGGRGLIADSRFEASSGIVPAGGPPYAWYAPGTSGVHVSVAAPEGVGGQPYAIIASDGFATGPVLAQTIVLSPGVYRLDVLQQAIGPAAPKTTWSLACVPPGRDSAAPNSVIAPSPSSGPIRVTGRFIVATRCPVSTLTLALKEGSGGPFSVRLNQVLLSRVSSSPGPAPAKADRF